MAKITFVLGGARSGKSAFAEGLAKKYNDVVYIATAEVKDDEMRERIQIHSARRPFNWKTIESPYHVDSVVSGLSEQTGVVFIDCITLYITNMLLSETIVNPLRSGHGNPPPLTPPTKGGETEVRTIHSSRNGKCEGENEKALSDKITNSAFFSDTQAENLKQKQEMILNEINKLSKVCRKSKLDAIIVSNEVGLGIVPDNALSRVFRDLAGRANQILADEADEVYFMVAGIALRIK